MDGARQLLVDLSVLVHQDDQSGIQRVVRNLHQALRTAAPAGWQVTGVYDAGGYYAYAEQLRPATMPRPIQVRRDDFFLGLDLCPDQVPANRAIFDDLRRHGVRIGFVVYDLLPLQLPQMFVAGAVPWFGRWLDNAAASADSLLCISRAVADDLLLRLETHPVTHPGLLRVDHFPLGADLAADPAAELALSAEETATLAALQQAPSLLMVGTLEPRKMHAQALAALQQLWADDSPLRLVIVGKAGWMTPELLAQLEQHPQLGRRLFWLRHASDAALLRLYRGCSGLLAASVGEGYGLPLIEAAHHGLPILARDLPVFREVCGAHASYFSGDADALALAIQQWLAQWRTGTLPDSAAIRAPSWADSGRVLFERLLAPEGGVIAPTLWR